MKIENHAELFEYIKDTFLPNIYNNEQLIEPLYILDSPYRELLISIAKGDGKIYSAIKKSNLSEALGESIVDQLIELNIVYVEESREALFATSSVGKNHRVQAKIRFKTPFYRFWFGFVEPFKNEILNNKYDRFLEYLTAHYERLRTLIYEQLSNEMLISHLEQNGVKIVHSSSYWDYNNEFDILASTANGELVIAECKYKDRKICKNELGKLKFKAEQSMLNVTYFALFSKDGFSKELLQSRDPNLFIFDLNDMKRWIFN